MRLPRRPLRCLLFLLASLLSPAAHADVFSAAFTTPPESARPSVYWYWISDQISASGITRDLEAMRDVGIGEAFIGNVDQNENSRGPVKALTPEWWALVDHALREGTRLGVKVGIFNCPGWSQSGGPWVRPDQAMRHLVWSETRVSGPASFRGILPAPATPFQDVATLAFPAPAGDTDTLARRRPVVTVSAGENPPAEAAVLADTRLDGEWPLPAPASGEKSAPFRLDFVVPDPFTARSLIVHSAARVHAVDWELLVSASPEGPFQSVRTFTSERRDTRTQVGPVPFAPVVLSFPAVTGRHFRLVGQNRLPRGATSPALVEIELSAAARVERAPEKQLSKLFEGALPPWNAYSWPDSAAAENPAAAIPPASVVNLSSRLAADGSLVWDVPPGDWIIQRAGMTPTGVENGPASPEARGLEVDKLNRTHVSAHFEAFAGKLLARLPAADRASLRRVIADSYETGSCNWTDGFAATFASRYGYDPLPWLPVLAGHQVGDAVSSDRFLWDLRRLVADLVATEYVGGLRAETARHGLTLWLENYGHWGFPSEFLLYGSQTDELGGEFWADGRMTGIELRAAASAAHTYGLPRVSAEAFTAGRNAFRNTLWDLKTRGDRAAAEGINHFVLHVYIHQPDKRPPGVNTWFGTEFNRHNTWFADLAPWIDSLRRVHGVLQAGRPAADLAYFIGEDTPRMTGPLLPSPPAGYDYDFVNADALRHRATVADGRLVFPGGSRPRLLVLPPQDTMRPETLERLRDLVLAGAALFGPPPARSPSLAGQPAADARVRALAAELWPTPAAPGVFAHHRLGAGHVFQGPDLAPALAALALAPDVADSPPDLLWAHRTDPTGDVYYVSNQSDSPLAVAPVFRDAPGVPEFWDPVANTRVALPEYQATPAGTRVPLALAPRQSGLLVFPRTASLPSAGPSVNFPATTPLATLAGPWSVEFSPTFGGPGRVEFPSLLDWTLHPADAIRTYSGPATYRLTFEAPASIPAGPVFLDLGQLHGQARVTLNGRDLGLVWCAPWRVAVESALRPGRNSLELRVTTPWLNRLLHDATLPAESRLTRLTEPERIPANSQPLPSGLLGPVTLQTFAP